MTELTVNGYKLVINPVSPLAPKSLEIQYKKLNPEPKVPTYKVEGVAGVEEEFPHTPETLSTTEEKEAYVAWKEKHEAWQGGLSYKLLRLFLSVGVTLKLTRTQEANLAAQLGALEMEVPQSDSERNLLYLETFIIDSAETMQKIVAEVLAKTGIKEQALESANALFQS